MWSIYSLFSHCTAWTIDEVSRKHASKIWCQFFADIFLCKVPTYPFFLATLWSFTLLLNLEVQVCYYVWLLNQDLNLNWIDAFSASLSLCSNLLCSVRSPYRKKLLNQSRNLASRQLQQKLRCHQTFQGKIAQMFWRQYCRIFYRYQRRRLQSTYS